MIILEKVWLDATPFVFAEPLYKTIYFIFLKAIFLYMKKSSGAYAQRMNIIEAFLLRRSTFPKLFTVVISLEQNSTLKEADVRKLDVQEAQALKKNILLVDDDASFLKMVKDWLSDDYRVTIVSSGMQAITYIAKNRPDLILLDFEMPVTSGPQVLEMIRSEVGTSNLPVFFLTGKGDKESVTKVLTLKPEGYILKSAGKTELVSQIKDYFERHKSV